MQWNKGAPKGRGGGGVGGVAATSFHIFAFMQHRGLDTAKGAGA